MGVKGDDKSEPPPWVRAHGHVMCWIFFFTSGDFSVPEASASRLRFGVSDVGRVDGEDDDEVPESLRIGLERFAAGGGFNLSVTPAESFVPPGFFTFSGPD